MPKKPKNIVIARSTRLYLSDFGAQYAPQLQKWLHDPQVYGHLRDLSQTLTLEDQLYWIQLANKDPTLKVYSIYYIPDDRLIGYGGFKNINAEEQIAEIWRIIGEPEYQGRGLGTELYWLLCDHGFRELGFQNILAEHFSNNPASWETAMKCGAKRMGTRREARWLNGQWLDVHYTDILPEELVRPPLKK
jgi:Acetyltransferases, including N-acetylases of ribosomal proteins